MAVYSNIKVSTKAFGNKLSTLNRERSIVDLSQLYTYLNPNLFTAEPVYLTPETSPLSLPSSLLFLPCIIF